MHRPGVGSQNWRQIQKLIQSCEMWCHSGICGHMVGTMWHAWTLPIAALPVGGSLNWRQIQNMIQSCDVVAETTPLPPFVPRHPNHGFSGKEEKKSKERKRFKLCISSPFSLFAVSVNTSHMSFTAKCKRFFSSILRYILLKNFGGKKQITYF